MSNTVRYLMILLGLLIIITTLILTGTIQVSATEIIGPPPILPEPAMYAPMVLSSTTLPYASAIPCTVTVKNICLP